jgi:hypothetical protein
MNINDVNIQKRLSENQKIFLNSLSNYIDDEIYLYGSIRRIDYIPDKSDLDIDLFTDNENSLIYKLCNLLHLKKNDFRKVVYKIENRLIYGYKTKYENSETKLSVELSIYNKKDREIIIKQHGKADKLSYVILFILYIVKLCYYKLGILSNELYSKIKNYLIHMSSECNFILL